MFKDIHCVNVGAHTIFVCQDVYNRHDVSLMDYSSCNNRDSFRKNGLGQV